LTHKQANTLPLEDYPKVKLKAQYDRIVAKHPEMKLYFPDYVKEYCPQRKFFWTVYRSLFEDEAQAEIEKHRLEKMGAQNEADTHITISAKFYEEFKDYYAKPGKAPNSREGGLSSQLID